MSTSLLSTWNAKLDKGVSTLIIPDGCRDLIVRTVGDDKPEWSVSPLFDRAELVQTADKCCYTGFRLAPGTEINERDLLAYIDCKQLDAEQIKDVLGEFICTECSVSEALACLASESGSVKQISAQLGVSVRTLQRLLVDKTKRTPGYWLQLARVRKAAKSLDFNSNLADVADRYGFSDQSHMNREFQRWFSLTPVQVLNTPSVISQLHNEAYG